MERVCVRSMESQPDPKVVNELTDCLKHIEHFAHNYTHPLTSAHYHFVTIQRVNCQPTWWQTGGACHQQQHNKPNHSHHQPRILNYISDPWHPIMFTNKHLLSKCSVILTKRMSYICVAQMDCDKLASVHTSKWERKNHIYNWTNCHLIGVWLYV